MVSIFINTGIYIFLLICIASVNSSFVAESSQTIQELCSSNRYIYSLEPGESHQLKLTSASSTGEISKWYRKSKRKCRKEFKTNNGASHFSIKVSNMTVPSCSEKCHCNYFELAEPGHEEKFCGTKRGDVYFESKGDYLSIDFQHDGSMQFEVTLSFTVLRNTYIITGVPKNHLSGHFLETPFFPLLYQSDYIAEYILQSDDPSGHVMLMFLDFQLAQQSFIEITGHNNTHLTRITGETFRPPVFASQKNQLNLRFEANNQLGSGFRAVCFFLKDSTVAENKPFTGCGGAKDGYGGLISIESSSKYQYYDCMWHINVPVFLYAKSFLSLSNITLENIGPKASLEFREGLNSKSKLVRSIICNNWNCTSIPTEITIPASSGLYVRFNGLLNPDSVVQMIYSTYRNGNCSENDLVCGEKCLVPALRCDGIEHCADGSDEQDCTTTIIPETTVFPMKKRGHSTATVNSFLVVLSFGICGLVFVVLVVIFALYRHIKLVPSQSQQLAQHQATQEMAGTLSMASPRVSSYHDQPPSYDDFIRSSEQYPPLLFTRAAKRSSELYTAFYNIQHTTSFCGKEVTTKRHSSPTFNTHSLKTTNSGEPSLFAEAGCSATRSDNELISDNSHLNNVKILKKATSLDSLMVKNDTSCHLHLSITHAICPHDCCTKYHSLPTCLKINDLKPNNIDITVLTTLPEVICNRERKFSSCILSHGSKLKSEIVTTIKARCQSDPWDVGNTQCSLYCSNLQ